MCVYIYIYIYIYAKQKQISITIAGSFIPVPEAFIFKSLTEII